MRYLSIADIVIVVSVAATLGQTRTPAQPQTPATKKTWTMTDVLSGARAEEKAVSTQGNAASPAGARGGRQ